MLRCLQCTITASFQLRFTPVARVRRTGIITADELDGATCLDWVVPPETGCGVSIDRYDREAVHGRVYACNLRAGWGTAALAHHENEWCVKVTKFHACQ